MMVQSDTFARFGYGERVKARVSPGKEVGKNDVESELERLAIQREEYEKLKGQHEELRRKRGKDALQKAKGKRAAVGVEASLQLLAAREKVSVSVVLTDRRAALKALSLTSTLLTFGVVLSNAIDTTFHASRYARRRRKGKRVGWARSTSP